MPVAIHHRRARQMFGPDCVFAITDWKGFLGNLAGNYATVTGTLEEVETPFGTGIQVAAANSYARFDWTGLAPLTDSERTVFVRVLWPATGPDYVLMGQGANAIRDGFFLGTTGGAFWGGFVDDNDSGGSVLGSWISMAVTNGGANAAANVVYDRGVVWANGTNAGAGVTAASDLYLFRTPWNTEQCPIGTTVQEMLVFNRVLSAAEILYLHNKGSGGA